MSEKKERKEYTVAVDDDICDGCGICVFFCKPLVFEMSGSLNRRGVFPAIPVKGEDCNNCRLCELGCPQLAIHISPKKPEEGVA